MMQPMFRPTLALACMLAGGALAKPWNGIVPGSSTKADVVKRFGPPTKTVTQNGREVMAYQKANLIKGTTQAQFKIDVKTQVVDRIDVFPAPVLTLADVSQAYGPACTVEAPETAERPCYLKRDDPQRSYVTYARLGLAIFFGPDGNTVQSFAFLPEKR
jgi:hypothetical protein